MIEYNVGDWVKIKKLPELIREYTWKKVEDKYTGIKKRIVIPVSNPSNTTAINVSFTNKDTIYCNKIGRVTKVTKTKIMAFPVYTVHFNYPIPKDIFLVPHLLRLFPTKLKFNEKIQLRGLRNI